MEEGNTIKGKTHQLVAVDRFWYSLEGNQLLSRNSLALNVARETVNIRYTNNLNATDRQNEMKVAHSKIPVLPQRETGSGLLRNTIFLWTTNILEQITNHTLTECP